MIQEDSALPGDTVASKPRAENKGPGNAEFPILLGSSKPCNFQRSILFDFRAGFLGRIIYRKLLTLYDRPWVP